MSALLFAKRLFMSFMFVSAGTIALAVYANIKPSTDLAMVIIFSVCLAAFCLVLAVVCMLHVNRFAAIIFWVGTSVLIGMGNYMYSPDSHPALLLCNIFYATILALSAFGWVISKMGNTSVVTKKEKALHAKQENAKQNSIENQEDDFTIEMDNPSCLFDSKGCRIHASGFYGVSDIH